ncbi:17296_t:CDS:2, partial [Gigaspora rosea]
MLQSHGIQPTDATGHTPLQRSNTNKPPGSETPYKGPPQLRNYADVPETGTPL